MWHARDTFATSSKKILDKVFFCHDVQTLGGGGGGGFIGSFMRELGANIYQEHVIFMGFC